MNKVNNDFVNFDFEGVKKVFVRDYNKHKHVFTAAGNNAWKVEGFPVTKTTNELKEFIYNNGKSVMYSNMISY